MPSAKSKYGGEYFDAPPAVVSLCLGKLLSRDVIDWITADDDSITVGWDGWDDTYPRNERTIALLAKYGYHEVDGRYMTSRQEDAYRQCQQQQQHSEPTVTG